MRSTIGLRRRRRAALALAAVATLALNIGAYVVPQPMPAAQAAELDGGFGNVMYTPDTCSRDGATYDDIPVKPDGGENPDMTYYPGIMTGDTPKVTPEKDDICGVWEGSAVVDGDVHYYLAWDISKGAGGTMSSIQILKSPTSPEGDIALDIDYSPSGGATVKAWRYTDGGFVQISSGFVVDYYHDEGANKFEIILNLTDAGVFEPGVCESLVSGHLYSRTSASFTATLKDQAGGGFTIQNCGSLVIDKVGLPELPSEVTDAYDFGYTVDRTGGGVVLPPMGETAAQHSIDGSLKIGETDTYDGVIHGDDYRLNEDELGADSPWEHVSTVCTIGETSHDVSGGETFPVEVGKTTYCTITNQTSLLEVEKIAHGDQEAVFGFALAADGSTFEPISITGSGLSGTLLVKPGTEVTITETLPDASPSWQLVDATPNGDLAAGTATVTTIGGELVTATFTNAQNGAIVIHKIVEGTTGPASFDFAIDWSDDSSEPFTIEAKQDGDSITGSERFDDVKPGGPYRVSETVPTGYDLTNVYCSDPSQDTVVTDDHVAEIHVDYGEVVECWFVNTERGIIEVEKVTSPAGYDQDFEFTLAPVDGTGEAFTLNAAGTSTWTSTPLVPGDYTLTESLPNGWSLVSVTADGVEQTVAEAGVTVTLAPGATLKLVFTNEAAPVKLTVAKVVDGVAEGAEWSFDFTVTGPDYDETKTISNDATDPMTFTDLLPGATYTLLEGEVDGWTQGAPVCGLTGDDGAALADAEADLAGFQFVATPGLEISCKFTNTAKPAELELEKRVAGYDGEEWSFDFSLTPAAGDDDGARTVTTDSPMASWIGLITRTQYTLTETAVDGWTGGAPQCGIADEDAEAPGLQFTAKPGQKMECAVTNIADAAEIVVIKTADGKDGEFVFELTPLNGGDPRTATIVTEDGTGTATFDGIVPGSRWSVREIAPESGWTVGELTGTVTAVDGTTRTIDVDDFMLNPGDRLELTVTNTAHGDIIVIKNVEGGDADFEFTGSWLGGDDGFTITTEDGVGSASFGDLKPGQYTLSELPTAGYDGLEMTCVETTDRTMTTVDGLTATIELDPGETVTCTVSNAEWGVIVVDKETVPAGADTEFDFALTGDGVDESFALTDESEPYVQRVAPGDYTVTETELDGWMLTGASCTEGAVLDGAGVTAFVGLGDTVTCTFTNAQRGDLDIDKTVVSGPERGEGDNWTTVYEVTVTSGSYVDEQYDLIDELRFGDGIDVTAVEVVGPEGVTLNAGWDGIADTTIAADATIAARGEHVYTVTVTATVDRAIEHDEAVCESGGGSGGSGWFNSATVEFWNGTDDDDECVDQPVANVSIDKRGTDRIVVEAGKGPQAIEYTLVVTNDGPATATDVVVTDVLPAEVAFGSATATAGTCTEADGTITCELGDLAAGGTVTITITGTVADTTAAGTIENVAEVTTTVPGDEPGDNRDDHDTPIEVIKQPMPTPTPTTPTPVVPKPGSPLPATGAVLDPTLGWMALALLAAGGGLLALRRRLERD